LKLLSDTLVEWRFLLNPYDQCMANKMINGKQCTIACHVDDQKKSHMDKKVVQYMINDLGNKFRKESPLVKS